MPSSLRAVPVLVKRIGRLSGRGAVSACIVCVLVLAGAASGASEALSLSATADAYVRSGAPDTNEGGSSFLRLRASGDNRALVRFDQAALQAAVGSGSLVSATLELQITENADNWGSTGRTVSAYRLTSDWAEGNGFVDQGSPPNRGTGSGATWACAVDADISDQGKDCSGATEWEMRKPNEPQLHPWREPATASVLITNGLIGAVSFDVTSDVQAFLSGSAQNFGWIVKKDLEGPSGQVRFGSRETSNGPRLHLVVDAGSSAPPAINITSPASGASVQGVSSVAVQANASAGVAQIEVWAGQRRVALITNSAPLPTDVSPTVSADLSGGPFGEVRLAAIVRDGLGRVAGDADTLVMVEGELAPEGPSTGLVLTEPVALSVLAPLIAESGVQVVEFFHERAFAAPISLDPGLAALLAEDGESADQEPDSISGGFYGRGLSLEEQIDTYASAYGEKLPGQEPQVFGLRIEGHVATADLGPLAPRVAARVELGARQAFSAAGLATSGPNAAIPDQPAAPEPLAAATATPRPPWWPTYGSFFTGEFTRTVPRTCLVVGPPFFGVGVPCPFLTVQQRRVEFFHSMVWKPAALTGFESTQWAYEHDFKVRGASRFGTKPFCTPIGRNDFYVKRRGVMWESSFRRAAPYFDTDKLDDCGTEDLTVGLALPEKLNDNRPDSNVTGWATIDARRGDPATGHFQLAAQSLLRETGFPCDQITVIDYFRKWCIGENGDETVDAVVVNSASGPNAGAPLPRCFAWRWLPVGSSSDGPTTFRGRSCEGEI